MAVYLISDLDVFDAEVFAEYQDGFPEILARHGGRYLVRGGDTRVMSGEWDLHRLVIFEFPDHEALQATFSDPDYAPLAVARERSARSKAFVVDGI